MDAGGYGRCRNALHNAPNISETASEKDDGFASRRTENVAYVYNASYITTVLEIDF